MTTECRQPKDFRALKSYLTLKELNTEVIHFSSGMSCHLQYLADTIKLSALTAITLLAEGSALKQEQFLECAIESKAELNIITTSLDLIEQEQDDEYRQTDTSTLRLLLKDAIKKLNSLMKRLKKP